MDVLSTEAEGSADDNTKNDGELDHSSGDPDSRAEEGMDELDVAMSEPGPSEAQAAFKIWGGSLPLKRKRERTDLFAEKQREDRRLDQQCKNVDIKGFLSAGVLLYNSRGYWLGFERSNGRRAWTDYGGKRQDNETAWETAVRECKEEAGIDISECRLKRPPDFHSESKAKHVLFWVETNLKPVANHHPNFLDHCQFTNWPDHELHPRLLYDKGHSIKKTREELGFEKYVVE